LIAIISISYVSAKGHYDLHEGKTRELIIKTEVHPTSLKEELENALTGQGISRETAKGIIGALGDDVVVLSHMIRTIKAGGDAVVPKEAAVITSLFFVVGTLPILIPFFVGAVLDSGPFIPAITAFVFAVIIISIAGLFIGVLSGQNISVKIVHNIIVIAGTCTATYLVGLAARIFFGIEAGH
jgi:VIT1/CCC1 family predicted Fe2+/Mn2+ transporter